jgi:hypothetical protein
MIASFLPGVYEKKNNNRLEKVLKINETYAG